MSIRFVYGRAGSGKSSFCFKEIEEGLKSGNRRIYVIVPEQYSFSSEKKLMKFAEGENAFNASVLSFKRMAYRVFSEAGGLTRRHMDKPGRLMMLYSITAGLKENLGYFAKMSGQTGFLEIVSDLIAELKRYDVSPEELTLTIGNIEGKETLKRKLEDVADIYRSFESRLHEGYIDEEDDMTLLYQKLDDSSMFDGAEIYFDEFISFTPQQYKIIGKLMKKAQRVTFTLCSDLSTSGEKCRNTDLFKVTKETENKLLKLSGELNMSYEKPVYVKNQKGSRFSSLELEHLEKNMFCYPSEVYGKIPERISLFKANNIYTEIEEVARDIARKFTNPEFKDLRFSDIIVAGRDILRYESLVRAVFSSYDIPFFMNEKAEISGNPFVVFIISALEIPIRKWSYESVFRYLKTGFPGLKMDEVDFLENYVLSNGIRGRKWTEGAWNYPYEGNAFPEMEKETEVLQRINLLKDRVYRPLKDLEDDIENSSNCRDMAEAIFRFGENMNIYDIMQGEIDYLKLKGSLGRVKEYEEVWNIFTDILDQLSDVIGEDKITAEEFVKLLITGFSSYRLGLIPPAMDQILFTSIDRMRTDNIRLLYLIGANDGVIPRASSDEGIINDGDRVFLKELGIELQPGTREKVFEEQYIIYKALTSASDYLRISYPIADSEGKALRPSMIISKLKKLYPALKEESDIINSLSKDNDIKLITRPEASFNELIAAARRRADGEHIEDVWGDAYKWFEGNSEWRFRLKNALEGIAYSNQAESVSRDKTMKLYGKPMYFSVSRLEKYSACPFSYFVQYGLKAKERRVYKLTSPDLGTFLHNALDEFARSLKMEDKSWEEVDKVYCEEATGIIVKNMLDKVPGSILNSSPKYRYLSGRLRRTLSTAIWIIARHIQRSSFTPEGYEESFGERGDYPPVKICLEDGEEINLVGRIDRVDRMTMDDLDYIRIVDYKSGDRNLSLTDIYYGLQLQLLVYLDAVLQSVQEEKSDILPAGILYFKIDDPIIKAGGPLSDEEIEKEVMKRLRMKGFLLDDPEVIKSMDNDLSAGGASDIIPAEIKKDGELGSRTTALSEEEFDALRGFVRKSIVKLGNDMVRGRIDIKPYKKGKKTPCAYCEYESVCQFDPRLKGNSYRFIKDMSDDEVWINIRKESEASADGNKVD